ncbi:uncharacterized protein LOC124689333 [Lolium rigidum]|uniref:uncharacterized protein LOC124689333 n=1 Tax=Lolium rigidum TaxID=89674 RepID=UPI001F5D0604|nr:uncharacterized protein LOC124689333 [Lolium rigidum]XP_051190711.1 uncharacterized protein LOC127304011 [Lolium perenne]
MKNNTLVVVLVLQAILVMGIVAVVNADGYVPKCCDNCNSFSGALVCDDTMDKCHPKCGNCVVVQEHPVKKYRCADAQAAGFVPCPPPCKKH